MQGNLLNKELTMNKTVSIQNLIDNVDYIEECGTCTKLTFEIVSEEDNTVVVTSSTGEEMYLHTCDKVPVIDGLILFKGSYYEAYIAKKVTL